MLSRRAVTVQFCYMINPPTTLSGHSSLNSYIQLFNSIPSTLSCQLLILHSYFRVLFFCLCRCHLNFFFQKVNTDINNFRPSFKIILKTIQDRILPFTSSRLHKLNLSIKRGCLLKKTESQKFSYPDTVNVSYLVLHIYFRIIQKSEFSF